jgi:hypothetical protein
MAEGEAQPCAAYRIDMTAPSFGTCKCGFMKAHHAHWKTSTYAFSPSPSPASTPTKRSSNHDSEQGGVWRSPRLRTHPQEILESEAAPTRSTPPKTPTSSLPPSDVARSVSTCKAPESTVPQMETTAVSPEHLLRPTLLQERAWRSWCIWQKEAAARSGANELQEERWDGACAHFAATSAPRAFNQLRAWCQRSMLTEELAELSAAHFACAAKVSVMARMKKEFARSEAAWKAESRALVHFERACSSRLAHALARLYECTAAWKVQLRHRRRLDVRRHLRIAREHHEHMHLCHGFDCLVASRERAMAHDPALCRPHVRMGYSFGRWRDASLLRQSRALWQHFRALHVLRELQRLVAQSRLMACADRFFERRLSHCCRWQTPSSTSQARAPDHHAPRYSVRAPLGWRSEMECAVRAQGAVRRWHRWLLMSKGRAEVLAGASTYAAVTSVLRALLRWQQRARDARLSCFGCHRRFRLACSFALAQWRWWCFVGHPEEATIALHRALVWSACLRAFGTWASCVALRVALARADVHYRARHLARGLAELRESAERRFSSQVLHTMQQAHREGRLSTEQFAGALAADTDLVQLFLEAASPYDSERPPYMSRLGAW